MEKKTKKILKIAIPCASVAIIFGICLGYMCTYSKAQNVDEYFKDSTLVKVKQERSQYLFDGPGTKDLLIFYPGGKVDEKAYAPLLYTLAANGIDTYLLKVPFHLAFFSPNKAGKIIDNYKYDNYYLGGHSLGGVAASLYASKTDAKLKGLIYFASYSSKDLSDKDFKVLSIYGTNDGVLNQDNFEKSRGYMPKNYTELSIEGGNHAQFGSYGKQKGDNDATITFQEQLSTTVTYVMSWLILNN